MFDYEDWYAYELELQQLWEEELEQINLELNTVSECLLSMLHKNNNPKKSLTFATILIYCKYSD
jgi:hypothetical protein